MKNDSMTAVICNKPGELIVGDMVRPEYNESLVRVRVQRVGVCGTDFHIYKGLHPFLNYPRVLGHELSGEVAAAPASSSLSVGDRVIVNPYLHCGNCIACRKGKENCCAAVKVLGVHVDGGMCGVVDVPETAVYPARELSLTDASMVEFLSIGAHAVKRGTVSAIDKVLVVGAGPIGLGVGIFSALTGASVTFLDANSSRVSKAVVLVPGSKGLATSDELDAEIQRITDGNLFDVVIDATGNQAAMQRSLDFVAHGGRCVYVSVVDDNITFSDPAFHAKEITLLGSRNATRNDFMYVMQCIRDGSIPVGDLNTHQCELIDVPQRIPEWMAQTDSLIKAIVIIP